MQIYIGSFSENFSQNNLREKLEEFGKVESLRIENEMVFAEMPFDNEATAAILHLNNSKFEGTIISVHKFYVQLTILFSNLFSYFHSLQVCFYNFFTFSSKYGSNSIFQFFIR